MKQNNNGDDGETFHVKTDWIMNNIRPEIAYTDVCNRKIHTVC